jgi:peptidoglycan-associated lipoprotein
MRATTLLLVLATAGLATACGGKPAPEQPAPDTTTQAPPAPEPAPVDNSAEQRRADSIAAANAAAERAKAVAADLAAMINFEYDQSVIRSTDQATLDRKASILGANPSVKIQISGHADERGSDEYNLALGNRRAAAAKRYLENKGIDASRMDVVSFGEERPLNPGHDETSYAQNRRDEFQVTAGGDHLVAPQ